MVQIAGFPSFLRASDTPCYVCTSFSIHSSYQAHLGCSHTLTIVSNAAWSWVCRCLFKTLIAVPLDTHPEVELLDHMGVQFLTF